MAVAWDEDVTGKGDMAKLFADMLSRKLGEKVEPDTSPSAGRAGPKPQDEIPHKLG